MSLAVIEDEIHQRLEAENADRGTYTTLANRLESAAAAEADFGRAGRLRSMAQAFRKVAQQEEEHLKAATKIYQDLGSLMRQQATARSEAGQLAKGALQTGRAAGRLAGRGISFVGRKLSALETEGGRLPVVSSRDVSEGLGMPGQPKRGVLPGSYYLDERLRELRHTQNPSNVIRLNEFEVSWFKERTHLA